MHFYLPFIFVFSFILMMSLLLLYFSQSLTEQDLSTQQLRMVLLAVAVILLDYAIQAIINPCGALMSDLMAGQQNEAQGFTVIKMGLIKSIVGSNKLALLWGEAQLSFPYVRLKKEK